MSLKINPKRINPFKISCCIFWNCEEKKIKNGQQLKVCDNGESVTVNIFDTGQIQCQGSADNPFLEIVKSKTKEIARTIELPFNESNHMLIQRAQVLLTYVKNLDPTKEIQRMTIIIICDTCCEILLKARIEMIAKKKDIPIKDLNLNDRGDMYKFIGKKGYIEVLEDEINNLRGRRNNLVHQGDIPTKKDSEFAIEVLIKYLDL